MDIKLPESIEALIEDEKYSTDDIGMSDSQVLIFKDKVLKIQPDNEASEGEYEIMKWLQGKVPVPGILDFQCLNGKTFLLMTKMSGKMCCDDEYTKEPEKLAALLSKGLKMWWKVDTKGCPRNYSLDKKLQLAEYRVRNNLVNVDDFEAGTIGDGGFKCPEDLLKWLEDNRPEEELMLSHGDFCLPNVFADKGKISGFIDFQMTGVCDKWQDIALCYRSLKHKLQRKYSGKQYKNYNDNMIFEKLGIELDWDKIRYYMFMDELF